MLAITTDAQDRALVAIRPFDLVAEDGLTLGATLFEPIRPHGVVLIHGATAAPQSYYRRFATFAAHATGARVITYDYRGIGRSRPAASATSLRGFTATLHDWAALDARAVHEHARRCFSGQPVVVVGHSFGGQLVGLIDEVQRDAAAVVMVGAQLAYYRDWPKAARLRLLLTWRLLVPASNAVFGYLPGRFGLGEDLPRGAAAQWARWCLEPDYLIAEYPEARERFARFDRPTLLYSFSDDWYAPPAAIDHLLRRLNAVRLDHASVTPREHGGAPIGHFGFFRERFAETLWQETAEFLSQGLAGRVPRRRTIIPREPDLRTEVMADLQYGRA